MTAGRRFAIGDIHGCARTFEALLAQLELAQLDTLFLLGDYIDRGSDVRGVIETILALEEDGFEVRPLRGNHEEMLLTALDTGVAEDLLDWMEQGGYATLRSYRVAHPREIPASHLHFLATLPYFFKTEGYVLVHAGLDLSLPDPFGAAGRSAMLWDRSSRADAARLEGRRLVTGHTPVSLEEVRASLEGDKIRLDNGCVFGRRRSGLGHLVALDLDSGELFLQGNIDLL